MHFMLTNLTTASTMFTSRAQTSFKASPFNGISQKQSYADADESHSPITRIRSGRNVDNSTTHAGDRHITRNSSATYCAKPSLIPPSGMMNKRSMASMNSHSCDSTVPSTETEEVEELTSSSSSSSSSFSSPQLLRQPLSPQKSGLKARTATGLSRPSKAYNRPKDHTWASPESPAGASCYSAVSGSSYNSTSNSTITTRSGIVEYGELVQSRYNDQKKVVTHVPSQEETNKTLTIDDANERHPTTEQKSARKKQGMHKPVKQQGANQAQSVNKHDDFKHRIIGCTAKTTILAASCDPDASLLKELEFQQLSVDRFQRGEELQDIHDQQSITMSMLDDVAVDATRGRHLVSSRLKNESLVELPSGLDRHDIFVTVDIDDLASRNGSMLVQKNQQQHHSTNQYHFHQQEELKPKIPSLINNFTYQGPVDLDESFRTSFCGKSGKKNTTSLEIVEKQRSFEQSVRSLLLDDLQVVYTSNNESSKLVLCVVIVALPDLQALVESTSSKSLGSKSFESSSTSMAATYRLFHPDTLELYSGGMVVVEQNPRHAAEHHRGLEHAILQALTPRLATNLVREIAGSNDPLCDENSDDDIRKQHRRVETSDCEERGVCRSTFSNKEFLLEI